MDIFNFLHFGQFAAPVPMMGSSWCAICYRSESTNQSSSTECNWDAHQEQNSFGMKKLDKEIWNIMKYLSNRCKKHEMFSLFWNWKKKWWTCRLSFWMFLAPGDLIDEKKGIHPWRNAGPWTVIPKWLKMAKVIQQAWWTWCENTSFGLRMPHGEQTKTTNTRRIKNSGWNS